MRIVMIGADYVGLASGAKAPIRLVETLVDVNDKRKTAMAAKVVTACGGSVAGKRIAVLVLTYRPKTDDMRDAPSLVIVRKLQAAGARIVAYDPEGVRTAKPPLPGIEFAENAYACLRGADAAVIVTQGDEFRAPSTLLESRPHWPRQPSSTCATSMRQVP
jgi:UDPglucose 6-dehydrogenase